MTTATVDDLSFEVAQRHMVSFHIFEPSDIPGYESNIASRLDRSDSQTKNLLRAVEELRDDPHFQVGEPVLIRPRSYGSKGEIIPAMYSVTIKPA